MKNIKKLDKKQLEQVTGGEAALDPNTMTQEERIAEETCRVHEHQAGPASGLT